MNEGVEFKNENQTKIDQYFSEPWVVDALFKHHQFLPAIDGGEEGPDWEFERIMIEPSNGGGAISKRLEQLGYKVATADIDPSLASDEPGLDWFDDERVDAWFHSLRSQGVYTEQMRLIERPRYIGAIITNPPFNVAAPYVRKALERCNGGTVAMLLRSTFDEPCSDTKYPNSIRWDLLTERVHCMSHTKQIVMPRIKFKGTGTDNVTASWFIWEHVPRLDFVKKYTITTKQRDELKDAISGQANLLGV